MAKHGYCPYKIYAYTFQFIFLFKSVSCIVNLLESSNLLKLFSFCYYFVYGTETREIEVGELCLFLLIVRRSEGIGKMWMEPFQNRNIWVPPGNWSSLYVDQET